MRNLLILWKLLDDGRWRSTKITHLNDPLWGTQCKSDMCDKQNCIVRRVSLATGTHNAKDIKFHSDIRSASETHWHKFPEEIFKVKNSNEKRTCTSEMGDFESRAEIKFHLMCRVGSWQRGFRSTMCVCVCAVWNSYPNIHDDISVRGNTSLLQRDRQTDRQTLNEMDPTDKVPHSTAHGAQQVQSTTIYCHIIIQLILHHSRNLRSHSVPHEMRWSGFCAYRKNCLNEKSGIRTKSGMLSHIDCGPRCNRRLQQKGARHTLSLCCFSGASLRQRISRTIFALYASVTSLWDGQWWPAARSKFRANCKTTRIKSLATFICTTKLCIVKRAKNRTKLDRTFLASSFT